MLFVIGIFTGSDALSSMIPTNTLIVIVGIVLMALAVAMMIPPIRHYATDRLLPLVKAHARQLIDVLTNPRAVVQRAGHADPQRGHLDWNSGRRCWRSDR